MVSEHPARTFGTEGSLKSLFTHAPAADPSVLFIVAHPGDEIVAAGGSFDQLKNARFLHVTDGAPRDFETAFDAGFLDRVEYARQRSREFHAALECAGLSDEIASQLGFAAGEISRSLATLTMSLSTVFRESSPDIVITLPYEGTHPDHDAIAFAAQTACQLLELAEIAPPLRLEAAGYSDWGGEGIVGEFVAPSFTESVVARLSPERRRLKQCMLERMPIRMRSLQNILFDRESFRIAPNYDFTRPPIEGILHYEKSGATLTGNRWRRMAEDALRALGLALT
jgi:LmbE family N-acetylglucosaminyl deacetylase